MKLETENVIYIATDARNGTVHVLKPRHTELDIVHLRLDDPDPESTDASEFQLLQTEMDETRIDL